MALALADHVEDLRWGQGPGESYLGSAPYRNLQIVPELESLTCDGAKFVDGKEVEFHSIILATEYKTNFSSWLKIFYH
ncbi:putative indole-3-pyruvate monooxygenase [Nymphaea thermarum]|nr:putative indole-3-pyruvate monooxygenase [Nymphaea thermarum]